MNPTPEVNPAAQMHPAEGTPPSGGTPQPHDPPSSDRSSRLSRRELRLQGSDLSPPPARGEHGRCDTARDERGQTSSTGGDSAAKSTTPRRSSGVAILSAMWTGLMVAVLLAVLTVGLLAIVVPAVIGGESLTVRTSSMEPGIPAGSMVVVRPTAPADIEPGMVMTFQLRSGEDILVTHRVTQRLITAEGEYRFITKGDNNPQADIDPVREVQVRGTVWYTIPYIGWVTNLLAGGSRAIVISVVVGGLLVYSAWMFLSSLRDRARRSRSASRR